MGKLFEGEFIDTEDVVDEKEEELVDVDVEEDEDDIDVEVVDDTPEEDKGKWSASEEEEEEEKETEIEGYSKNVQKRINSLTAKREAFRRRAEASDRELAAAAETMKTIIEENNFLKDMIEGGEKAFVSERISHMDAAFAEAKRAYVAALEAEDHAGAVDAQSKMTEIAAKKTAAEQRVFQPLQKIAPEQVVPRVPQAPQATERDEEWGENNPWFGQDERMTDAALTIHKRLVTREGIMPNTPQYYEAIDKEMRSQFRDYFKDEEEEEKPKKRQKVGGARRTSHKPKSGKVQVTKSQEALAKRLGVPLKEYARHYARHEQVQEGRNR